MSDNRQPPQLTFGVGAPPNDPKEAATLFEAVYNHGIRRLDSARSYTNSEATIGTLKLWDKFVVSTKAPGTAPGSGRKEEVSRHAQESIEALGVDSVDIYMLHAPDITVRFSETIEAIQELYKAGRFKRFGISNFSAEQVQIIYDLCKAYSSGILPTVYQAHYNLLCRIAETDLFPLLRSLNMSIQAYSPLCGGLFVKDPRYILIPPDNTAGGRWQPSFWYGKLAQKIFNKPGVIRFLEEFDKLAQLVLEKEASQCEEVDLKKTKMSLAYRWVMYHSVLDGGKGDEVIFASNRAEQVDETMEEVQKGRLDEWILERLEAMWERAKDDSPPHDYLAYGLDE